MSVLCEVEGERFARPGTVRKNAVWTLRSHLVPDADKQNPPLADDDGLEAISLTVSVARRAQIKVPQRAFVAVVYVGVGAPLELTISIPGKTDRKITQRPGEVCILGPCSATVFPAVLQEQIIQYRVPHAAIRGMARYWNLGQIDSLKSPVVRFDPVMHHLSRVTSRLLEQPKAPQASIADQFIRAFYSHLLHHYGRKSSAPSEFSGGLSPRHRRVVDEFFAAPMDREISIKHLADRCELSAGHFARVFRESFGRPFHQHVMRTRIQRSKQLLEGTDLSLSDIARRVGYADQTTFTESFTRAMRTSPGRFRRRHLTAKEERDAPSRAKQVLPGEPNHDLI